MVLQSHKNKGTTIKRSEKGLRSRSRSPPHSGVLGVEVVAPEIDAPGGSSFSPNSIKGLLGRIDQTLYHVDQVLDDKPARDLPKSSAGDQMPSESGNRISTVSLEELKRRVRGTLQPSHHAMQASSRPTSTHSADSNSPEQECTGVCTSLDALPDLSPCSTHDLSHSAINYNDHAYQDSYLASYLNAASPATEAMNCVSVTANLKIVAAPLQKLLSQSPLSQSPLSQSPLSLSSKPPEPLGVKLAAECVGIAREQAHTYNGSSDRRLEKTEAVEKAKEQALRKAREDCDRLFSSGKTDLLSSLKSRHDISSDSPSMHVIDVLSSPQANPITATQPTHDSHHHLQQHLQKQQHIRNSVNPFFVANSQNLRQQTQRNERCYDQPASLQNSLCKQPIYAPQQTATPAQQSAVGQPIVVNLGYAKKQQQQQQPLPLRKVQLHVLSQQQPISRQQHPQQQQQHVTNSRILSSYTQVHFPGDASQQGTDCDGFAKPYAFHMNSHMNSQKIMIPYSVHAPQNTNRIVVPRLKPQEREMNKENYLHHEKIAGAAYF